MNRRSFLSAMLLAGAAPAIVKASSIMRVQPRLWLPPKSVTIAFGPEGDALFVASMDYSTDGTIWLPMPNDFRIPAQSMGLNGSLMVRTTVAHGPRTFRVVSD